MTGSNDQSDAGGKPAIPPSIEDPRSEITESPDSSRFGCLLLLLLLLGTTALVLRERGQTREIESLRRSVQALETQIVGLRRGADRLEVRELLVVDSNGEVRAVLSSDNEPALSFMDESGAVRAFLGSSALNFMDESGAVRANFGLFGSELGLRLLDGAGVGRAKLVLDNDGLPRLDLADSSNRPRLRVGFRPWREKYEPLIRLWGEGGGKGASIYLNGPYGGNIDLSDLDSRPGESSTTRMIPGTISVGEFIAGALSDSRISQRGVETSWSKIDRATGVTTEYSARLHADPSGPFVEVEEPGRSRRFGTSGDSVPTSSASSSSSGSRNSGHGEESRRADLSRSCKANCDGHYGTCKASCSGRSRNSCIGKCSEARWDCKVACP